MFCKMCGIDPVEVGLLCHHCVEVLQGFYELVPTAFDVVCYRCEKDPDGGGCADYVCDKLLDVVHERLAPEAFAGNC